LNRLYNNLKNISYFLAKKRFNSKSNQVASLATIKRIVVKNRYARIHIFTIKQRRNWHC